MTKSIALVGKIGPAFGGATLITPSVTASQPVHPGWWYINDQQHVFGAAVNDSTSVIREVRDYTLNMVFVVADAES